MTLLEWCFKEAEANRPGPITRLQRATGLAYTTVHAIVHGGACKVPTAKLLSEATGGDVPWTAIAEQSGSGKAADDANAEHGES